MIDARVVRQQRQWFAASAALLAGLGLVLQFYGALQARPAGVASMLGAVAHVLSFFTIWTNLLATLMLTLAAGSAFPHSRRSILWMTGVAVSMALVGIAYHVLLRALWHPVGTLLLANYLLHYVTPILFLIFWWLFVAPAQATWRDALRWAIYPACYLVFVLVRGAFGGLYAYPFLDVNQLGYLRVLLNAAGVTLGFFAIAFMLLWLDHRKL